MASATATGTTTADINFNINNRCRYNHSWNKGITCYNIYYGYLQKTATAGSKIQRQHQHLPLVHLEHEINCNINNRWRYNSIDSNNNWNRHICSISNNRPTDITAATKVAVISTGMGTATCGTNIVITSPRIATRIDTTGHSYNKVSYSSLNNSYNNYNSWNKVSCKIYHNSDNNWFKDHINSNDR